MPPYRRYYRWNNPYRYKRRRWFRRRRPATYLRRRLYRKRRPVRRKTFKIYKKRKLKTIILRQYQPNVIKKCRIQGMFSLFQAGYGRFSNNYEMYRESFVPEKQPGGGGWSIFQLSLNSLYLENQQLLNWWTKSNKGLNLVRYQGVTIKLYRQPTTDYVVNYQTYYPFEYTKYHFASSHPERLLTYHKKIIVPSLQTAPLLKKTYIRKKIKPPKEFQNKWYFQKELCRFGLIMITASACSLDSYFIDPQAESNNITLYSINTEFFIHKDFKQTQTHTFGYNPGPSAYLFGTTQVTDNPKEQDLIYLGNTTTDQEGDQATQGTIAGTSTYTYKNWGNPFHSNYLNDNYTVWQSNLQPTQVLTGKPTSQASNIVKITKPIIKTCRYNPLADKGTGNVAKWLNNFQLESNWNTDPPPEQTITGFPLWLLLWGWEDWTRKAKTVQHLDTDYMLVIHTDYIEPKLPAYVFLSSSYIAGEGPYHLPGDERDLFLIKNWYPQWTYQKEAIETILMSGPAVARKTQQIQAHMHYNFHFKWGGAPAYFETARDPCSQPSYPLPNNQPTSYEIENPENDPTKELYSFDVRRDFLTKTAAERINSISSPTTTLFTDGVQTLKRKTTSETETSQETPPKKKKTKKTLEQQLQHFQQRRQQLQLRYLQLTKQLLDSKSHIAKSE
nr:MAG: ORF1 [TTV-like mini virus]